MRGGGVDPGWAAALAMAGAVGLLMVLGAPASAGTEAAPEMLSARGDVTFGGGRDVATGLDADVVDVLAVWFEPEGDDGLRIHYRVASLAQGQERAQREGYAAQYAVSFQTPRSTDRFTTHAAFIRVQGSTATGECAPLPVQGAGTWLPGPDRVDPLLPHCGVWRFSVQDESDRVEFIEDGSVDLDTATMAWTVPRAFLRADQAGDILTDVHASAWAPGEDGVQLHDGANMAGRVYDFTPGPAPWRLPPSPGDLRIEDAAWDALMRAEEPPPSDVAAVVDLQEIRFHDASPEAFRLSVVLGSIAMPSFEDKRFHVQYAVSFTVGDRPETFEGRATFRRPISSGDPPDGWEFSLHDTLTNRWPAIEGSIDPGTQSFTLVVPRALLGEAGGGGLLTFGHASSWASEIPGLPGEQVGDWAHLEAARFVLGPGPGQGDDAAPAGDHGAGAGGGGDALWMGVPAVASGLSLGGLVLRRRRGA